MTKQPNILSKFNTKIAKGEKLGYYTVGVHLAPADLSGFNTCPMASEGCKLACLNTAGMGVYKNVQAARIAKTRRLFNDRDGFMAQLINEIRAAIRKAGRMGMKLAVRLNLTSDIQWENIEYQGQTIFQWFPGIQFYDYSKIARRFFKPLPANYHLTFSRSESNQSVAETVAAAGNNVAVVFSSPNYPATYMGKRVVSGDDTDLRFLDDKNVIVGLYAKGKAKKDTSGFVVKI